jgi:predicted AlkP superfamily phosphohydrolase/phosphomutase
MLRRLITLGLDGIDFPLLKEWAADGRLPVLRGLLEESRTLLLGAPNRPLPGSIWTDIATGVSAAVHGFIHEEQLRVGSYQIDPVNASRVSAPPYYKTLSDAGVRCAVVDFPVDYPLDDFNGIQVIDWATEFKLWRFETRPASFTARLAKYGEHPFTRYPGTRTSLDDMVALERKLMRGIEIKRQFAIDLIHQREHEYVFVNFCEIHKAGHFFWRFHDRNHPEFTDAVPELVHALRETYETLDRALGSVLQQLGDDDDLIVVTDRGMYSDHRADHLVDGVLSKLEWLVPRGRAPADAATQVPAAGTPLLSSLAVRKALGFVARRVLPDSVREALLPFHRAMTGGPPPLDWTKTRVFRLPNVGNSYLRVNLAGREPNGTVASGAEYDALLSEVAAKFRALINPATGEHVVEDISFPAIQFQCP